MAKYILEDITKSYHWLGHKPYLTELNAYHPDYQPGKEYFKENLKNKTLPKVWYANSQKAVLEFVVRYALSHMVCFGINPRPQIFKNTHGYARSAYEKEIEISQNMFMDLDVQSKQVTKKHIAQLELFFEQFDQYFLDQKLNVPVKAFTGRGFHLLFPYSTVKVSEHPDIAKKQKVFAEQFKSAYQRELDDLEVRIDSTFDLRRMSRIYGTQKPNVGIVSKFYGEKRKEDPALRDYLLNLHIPEPNLEHQVLETNNELPQLFKALLERDKRLQELWRGEGKSAGSDVSRSGYDMSLCCRLLKLGITDFQILAIALSNRPNGAVQGSGKGESYIKHTIANAIKS